MNLQNKIIEKKQKLNKEEIYEKWENIYSMYGREQTLKYLDTLVNVINKHLEEELSHNFSIKNIFNTNLLLEEAKAIRVLVIDLIIKDNCLALIIKEKQEKPYLNTLKMEKKYKKEYMLKYFS